MILTGLTGYYTEVIFRMSGWTVEFVSEKARLEFMALPADIRASLNRVVGLIRSYGLPAMTMPYVRHLHGKVWEIRGRSKDGIGRSLYAVATGRRVVILRSFVKKVQKTPKDEIEIALKRAKEAGHES